MSIGVLIVDDHPMLRAGLRAILGSWPGLQILGEAATGEEGVALTNRLHPEVVLCDLRLGAGMGGVATTVELRALPNPPAVIILTTFDRDADILAAIEAGAIGYLLKDVSPDTLVAAIHEATQTPNVSTNQLRSSIS